MKTLVNKWMLDNFREFNCKAKSCEECENSRTCLLRAFFETEVDEGGDGSDIELAVKALEDSGFHVTDVREERAIRTGTSYVIDDNGTVNTGAILIRAVAVSPTDQ